MSLINGTRSGCKDVFRAFMVQHASYEGNLEIPCIAPIKETPEKLISFSKSISSKEFDAWVHPYEDDASLERLWNNPKKYLPILKRYKGVITPDFSLYRDMPLVMQQWNLYRSQAFGTWLQDEGLSVIPNVRWGDERTFNACTLGKPKNSTIAIGSHGCIKSLRDREFFVRGLDYVVTTLQPKMIVVYGTAPESIFGKYEDAGIQIIQFDSDFMIAHRKRKVR